MTAAALMKVLQALREAPKDIDVPVVAAGPALMIVGWPVTGARVHMKYGLDGEVSGAELLLLLE
jgi:hypothetical protein